MLQEMSLLANQPGKEEAGNPEALYAQRQENDMVQEGLLRLPEEQRAAIILTVFPGPGRMTILHKYWAFRQAA